MVNGEIEMTEVGPRFQLKLYQIKLGTIDEAKVADTESEIIKNFYAFFLILFRLQICL